MSRECGQEEGQKEEDGEEENGEGEEAYNGRGCE